ncbi:MAG: C4-dicarboxylate ABC transporter, partial [Candidatus Competibacteraceae bacterium]|nr:C4-dicarboxylate ABC transporter [Candidatus Competibacteraceae bacterium]
RIHEVTDHHTQFDGPGIYTLVFLFGMNQDRYRSLPEDLRTIIDRHSGMNIAAKVGRMWDEAEDLGRALAVEQGNTITTLSPQETERWRQASRPVVEAWVAEMDRRGLDGEALLEEARGLIEHYQQSQP